MSQHSTLLFTVTLRHLSADGKKAGADLPKAQLPYVSVAQLLSLLRAIEALAPSVAYPAEPEIRISGGSGEFVVRVKTAQLHLVSWSSAHKGGVSTPEQIVAALTNEDVGEPVQQSGGGGGGSGGGGGGIGEKVKMVALGLAIVGINAFTVWFLTKPPRNLVGDYRLISDERAERIIEEAAGTYETGKKAGDRRVEIAKPSFGKRIKFGASGAIKDVQTFEVKPVEAGGAVALLAERKPPTLIKVKDPSTVVIYGDTYTRVRN
jgi:hypothetical protein